MSLISNLFIRLTADTTKFQTGMSRASRQLKESQRQFAKTAGAVRNLASSFGMVISAGAIVGMTKQAIDLGSRLDDTSKKLGISTELLQVFGFAARETGVKTQAAEMGLQRFTRRLAEAQQGGGELLPVLEKYNIGIKNADGSTRDASDVLRDFADAIKGAESNQERLRMAFKAFDSEGAGLVTVLSKGAQGLDEWGDAARRAGQVMSEETIAALAEAENEIERFTNRLTILTGKTLSLIDKLTKSTGSSSDAGYLMLFGQAPPSINGGGSDGKGNAGANQQVSTVESTAVAFANLEDSIARTNLEAEIFVTTFEAGQFAAQASNQKFSDSLASMKLGLESVRSEVPKLEKVTTQWISDASDGITSMASALENGLINAARDGKAAFGDMANYILAEIQRIIIRAMILRPLFGGIGNWIGADTDIGKSFIDAFRANGGPVSAGKTYMVGERGPELFTPSGSGHIIPNNQLGGGGGPTFYVDNRGASVDAVARLEAIVTSLNGSIEQRALAAVGNQRNRNPGFLMR